jgi:integrase/recombinase XerD
MSATFKVCLKAYKDKNGLQQLAVRITMDRKARYADSGYNIQAKQFNPSNPENPVRAAHKDAGKINQRVAGMIDDVKAWLKQYPDAGQNELIQVAEGNPPERKLMVLPKNDFFTYADNHLNTLAIHQAYSTFKNVRIVINHAKAFTGGELMFEQINLRWAKDFQQYLLTHIQGLDEQKKTNSARTYINKFAHIFKLSMEDEIIPIAANPFSFLKWKKTKVRRIPLDESEIQALEEVKLKEGSAEFLARNVFLFQFYLAGMRISDVILLRWNMINDDRVDYMMKKTRQEMSFPLVEKAARLLRYYAQWKEPDGFVFPLLSNKYDYSDKTFRDKQISVHTVLIDRYIKKAALKAGITKPISSHLARHTFGHLATMNGLSSYDLRDCFGHSTTRMTDAYTGQFNQQRLDRSLKKVMGESDRGVGQ